MSRMMRLAVLIFGFAILVGAPASQAQRRGIYPENVDPAASIAAALKQAKAQHKRVLLDFGGDWCGDCQVLDIYFHQGPNLALLQSRYVLVHIFVKETMDNNIALGQKYGVPIEKGVPALSVLDEDGKIIYSQRTGQFNDMRHMDPASVNAFLTRWKG